MPPLVAFSVLQLVSELVKDHSTLIGRWSTKVTWSAVPANHCSSMEQTTPIERFACRRIFRGLIGKFGRFVRMLITLCLMHATLRIKLINTMQIARLAVLSFRVFHFLSLRESPIAWLLERSRWGFRAIMREPHRSKPDSLRCTSESMRTSLSWMESLSIPCSLAFRRLWRRCGQTSHNYLMMIMRGHSSYNMP